jgi:hypothetical protein
VPPGPINTDVARFPHLSVNRQRNPRCRGGKGQIKRFFAGRPGFPIMGNAAPPFLAPNNSPTVGRILIARQLQGNGGNTIGMSWGRVR